jgi:phage gp36-like protein
VAYATGSDIERRVGSVQYLIAADRDGDGVADLDPLEAALQDATNEIDSYLASRYSLPLTTVPAILTQVCADIAFYRLSDTSSTLTDEKANRYKLALDWLKAVAADKASLGVEDTNAAVDEIVEYAAGTRQFTRSKLGSII